MKMNQLKQALGLCKSSLPKTPLSRCYTTSGGKIGGQGSNISSTSKVPKSSASTATAAQPISEEPVSAKSYRSTKVSLDEPLPGLPDISYDQSQKLSYDTKLSTTKNGFRVGSQERYGKYCTIGVAIKSGARFENGYPRGISHIAEKLGFLSTQNFQTKEKIMKELEIFGGICDSQTSRDTTVYAISTERSGLERMMKLLYETVFRPRITEEELSSAQMAAIYELEDMEMKPEQEGIILEMIHAAAWQNNTLGFPRFCPSENVKNISREQILKYMKAHFIPERMVVSGVGVEHQELVDLTNHYFDISKATWNQEALTSNLNVVADDSEAQYTGGELKIEKDFGQFNAGPMPVPKLAHMAIGLESMSHWDPDFIPGCVLNIMMGGGGSFSAGGPGKGMYSRLYTNVLNLKHWVYNATAYNNSYGDSGVFCIYASSPPEYMGNLTSIIMKELHGMAGPIEQQELERSKIQLQSMLLMNLESRPVVFEDIGRQILAHGSYKSPNEYMALIEKVQQEDIQRVAKRMLKSKTCLAALGSLTELPQFGEILKATGELRDTYSPSVKNRLFRS